MEDLRRSLGRDRSISRGEGVKIERFGEWPTTRETRADQDRDCGIVRSRYARVLANLYSVPPRYQGSRVMEVN